MLYQYHRGRPQRRRRSRRQCRRQRRRQRRLNGHPCPMRQRRLHGHPCPMRLPRLSLRRIRRLFLSARRVGRRRRRRAKLLARRNPKLWVKRRTQIIKSRMRLANWRRQSPHFSSTKKWSRKRLCRERSAARAKLRRGRRLETRKPVQL